MSTTNPSDLNDSIRTCSFVADNNDEGSDCDANQREIDDESKHKSDMFSSIDSAAATLSPPPQVTSSNNETKEEEYLGDCSIYKKSQNLSLRKASSAPSSLCASLDGFHDVVVDDIDVVELDHYLEDVQQSTSFWNLTRLQ